MWLLLALVCALLVGTGDILSKYALRKSPEGIVGLARLLFGLPILGVALWIKGMSSLPLSFGTTILWMLPLELSAYLLYLKAIRVAPLSLTVPFLSLTPVFTILTSWLLLGEKIPFAGAFGILAVTVGAYLLYLDPAQGRWFEPLLSLFREEGSRFMICAAFLYSITSNLGKRAIQLSDPFTFAFLYQTLDVFVLWLFIRRNGARSLEKQILSQWKIYLSLGSVMAFAFLVHCLGIAQAPVPYFIAVKRTSMMVGVLYGGYLFKEERILQRVIATGCMVVGVGLIAVFR